VLLQNIYLNANPTSTSRALRIFP